MAELDDTISLLGELISYPTVSAESNLSLIAALAQRLEDVGARVMIDSDETGAKANLFASLGPEEDGGIVLSGHSDVVPVADQPWTNDPFEMVERDGKLFGRGTCDMKGFIAAAVAKAPDFAATRLDRPIHFAFTYDEEVGCVGAQALARMLKNTGLKPGVALIGEPTSMRIIEGHKGCCEYSARFHGLAGHGSNPDRGVNAVEYAVRYVARLLEIREALKGRAPPGSRFDPPWTTINTGGVHGGTAHNVIAEVAQVDWEFRPIHTNDFHYVKAEIEDYVDRVLLPAMQAVSPDATITTEVIGEVVGLEPTTVNEAKEILMELTGANTADVVAFGTEAGIFQEIGMSAVICGPGSIDQAHKADEFVSIDQMRQCLDMLDRLQVRHTI